MENLDVEFFIDAVKEKPCLWDSSSEEYKNRQLKRDAWKEICDIINPELSKGTEKEKQEIGKAVQLKWKNLRDAFIRHRRQKTKKSGDGAKPVKTYIYAKQLEFLGKVTDSCQTETSLPNTVQESQDDLDLSQNHDDMQDRQLININRKSQTPVTPSRSTQFRRNKSAIEKKLMTYMDSQIKQPSPVIQNQPKETEDMAFFRSLQTTLDTLTQDEKLNFRIEVMQSLTRYTNKKPNQDAHNFSDSIPAYQQPQQYPVMANFPYTRFNTPMPAQTSYSTGSLGPSRTSYSAVTPGSSHTSCPTATVSSEFTFSPFNSSSGTRGYSNTVESVDIPATSPIESVDSIMSEAESLISLP